MPCFWLSDSNPTSSAVWNCLIQPWPFDIPDVNAYISNFTYLSHAVEESGLDLQKVSQAIAEARSTYENPNIELDAELTWLPFVEDDDFLGIFVICSTLTTAALIVIIVIMACKLRKLNTYLTAGYIAASQTVPKTSASYVLTKSTAIIPPTSTLQPPSTVIMTEPHYVTVTLCIITAFIAGYLIRLLATCLLHYFRLPQRVQEVKDGHIDQQHFSTPLAIHVTNTHAHVTLSLTTLPYPKTMISMVDRPELETVYSKDSFSNVKQNFLHLKWSGPLHYEVDNTPIELPLSTLIAIPHKLCPTFTDIKKCEASYPISSTILFNLPPDRLRTTQEMQAHLTTPTPITQVPSQEDAKVNLTPPKPALSNPQPPPYPDTPRLLPPQTTKPLIQHSQYPALPTSNTPVMSSAPKWIPPCTAHTVNTPLPNINTNHPSIMHSSRHTESLHHFLTNRHHPTTGHKHQW